MKPGVDPTLPDPTTGYLEQAPMAMVAVEGATHIVRYVNPAFCRLIKGARENVLGRPFPEIWPEAGEFLTLLDNVYRSGKVESYTRQEYAEPRHVFRLHTMWPVIADGQTVGVMVEVTESVPLYESAVAMNEALILGSLRQHELIAGANNSNIRLQAEVAERKQRELDARMMTREISHRIKNNLQIVVGLIGHEARHAVGACFAGYEAMQRRIGAIATLYNLISQSSLDPAVPVDTYLAEIATNLSATLLAESSNITIEAEAEALQIDPERAVPFGLLINELATNAIKHAFPDGEGRVVLSARRIDDEIELDVADDGAGMWEANPEKTSENRGSDYVAIFVRQLRGKLEVLESTRIGTTVRVRFPLLVP
jgi:two-component sensor histidine kinase